MGVVLIILGIGIWIFWANDINKGKRNSEFYRNIHSHPAASLPFILSIILVIIGIVLLV